MYDMVVLNLKLKIYFKNIFFKNLSRKWGWLCEKNYAKKWPKTKIKNFHSQPKIQRHETEIQDNKNRLKKFFSGNKPIFFFQTDTEREEFDKILRKVNVEMNASSNIRLPYIFWDRFQKEAEVIKILRSKTF